MWHATINAGWLMSLGVAAAAGEAAFTLAPVFTVAPLEIRDVREIIPLGNLNPRHGHVFPTDHIYFDYGGQAGLPVRAPVAGAVFAVLDQSVGDLKLEIRVNEHLCYYLAHLVLEPGIVNGSRVSTGQVVGRTSGRSHLDLGAYDDRVRLSGFSNPARYPASTLHAVAPLALFAEPVRSPLYARVRRDGPDRDGRIDFDRPGRLVGNWFHESLAGNESSRGTPETWSKQLAFVYDVRIPVEVRIAIGGTVAPAGTYALPAGVPDPTTVSADSGLVKYVLLGPLEDRPRTGNGRVGRESEPNLMLAQVLPDGRLMVQCFPGKTPADVTGFTDAACIYER